MVSIALPIAPSPRAQTLAQSSLPDTDGEPRIRLPALILAAPASEARFPIEIEPPSKVPPKSFVRLRGLPPAAALNAGHAIAPGSWAVPVAALDALLISIPVGVAGKSDISVALVTIDGLVISEARTALVVAAAGLIAPRPPDVNDPPHGKGPPDGKGPAAGAVTPQPAPSLAPARGMANSVETVQPPEATRTPPAQAPLAPQSQPQPPASAPSVSPPIPREVAKEPEPPPAEARPSPKAITAAARQRAEGFLTRGRALMREGNIVQSRLFFERAADEGLADGALAMGGTYDPTELAKVRVQGLAADRDSARRWYERARQLGSQDAQSRLDALDRR